MIIRRFVLEVNEKRAELIRNALELYIRIRIGQWHETAEVCMRTDSELSGEDYYERKEQMRPLLGEARAIWFPELGKDLSGNYGVSKFADTRIAYDVFQVLRHRMSWVLHPEGSWTVDFDRPAQFSDQPFPLCEVKRK